jgi:hypothetical protein
MDNQGIVVNFPSRCERFYRVQTDSEAHPEPYSLGTGDFPQGVKLATVLHLFLRLRVTGVSAVLLLMPA